MLHGDCIPNFGYNADWPYAFAEIHSAEVKCYTGSWASWTTGKLTNCWRCFKAVKYEQLSNELVVLYDDMSYGEVLYELIFTNAYHCYVLQMFNANISVAVYQLYLYLY